jgi:hypothetical protein
MTAGASVHVHVTDHPTAAWTRQQIRETFPWDQVLRYLLHDRDGIYGPHFRDVLCAFDIDEVASAPRTLGSRLDS